MATAVRKRRGTAADDAMVAFILTNAEAHALASDAIGQVDTYEEGDALQSAFTDPECVAGMVDLPDASAVNWERVAFRLRRA
jgi:hypothetical protein